MRALIYLTALLGAAAPAQDDAADGPAEVADAAAEATQAPSVATGEGEVRSGLGMSILGNEEAPKALVIVPWKSSQIGDGLGVTDSMDDRARPVDREVFMREVRYYELRTGASDE